MANSLRDPRYRAVIARLIELRKSAGLNQRELAARLKRTQSYVAKYELHERRLDIIQLLEVLDALDADVVGFVKETATAWRRSKAKRS